MTDRQHWLDAGFLIAASGLLCVIVWLVFGGAIDHFFAQDDFVFLSRSAEVDSVASWVKLFLQKDHFYRPFPRTAVITLEWRLFGLQADRYHLLSILVHAANAWLVLLLTRTLTRRRVVSLLAAVVYAAHPAHYVSVYWVSGVQELCLAFFYLATVTGYALFLRSGQRFWYWLSVAALLLGFLSKEMMITAPATLLLLDLVWRPPSRTAPPPSRQRVADAVPIVALVGFFVFLRLTQTPGIPAGPYAPALNPSNLLESLRWFGLEMLYLHSLVTDNTVLVWTILGAITVSFLSLATWAKSAAPWVGIGIIALNLGFLLPFGQHKFAYYLNVPLIGFALAVAGILSGVLPADWRWRRLTPTFVIVLALGCVLVGRSGVQLGITEDPVGLIDKSAIAQHVMTRLLERYPSLPEDSTLYLTNSNPQRYWAVGSGKMFNLLYGNDLNIRFDHLDPLSAEELAQPDVFSLSLSP